MAVTSLKLIALYKWNIIIIIFLAHQHKAAGVKIKLSKNNDHDGYHTASNVTRNATAFTAVAI